jgi:two-component system nitrogen regulation sensor histidine kinase GlnL
MTSPSPATLPLAPDATAILDALAVPILVVEAGLFATYMNSAAEQFLSSSTAYMRRHSLREFLPEDSPLIDAVEQVRRTGRTVTEYGVELGSHRLPTRPVDIQATPFGEDGQVLLTLQERTIAVAMDRRLSNRAAARTISGLAAVLAHEIKNPLAGIKGAAQLLGKTASEADKPLAELISEETDRITGLVDRMERFGEVKHYPRGPVNIHAVLERVEQIGETSFAKDVEIIEDYDPSLPPVLGHRDELVQLFLNLAKNAADAMDGRVGGKITLKTAYHSGMKLSVPGSMTGASLPIEVTVTDNGPGIPEDLLPIIFDPFITSKRKGQGLGLALVAKIVGEHGGVIECSSEPGCTQFRVLLPMAAEGANENEDQSDGG